MNIKKDDLYLCYNNFKKEWEFTKYEIFAYCFDTKEELEKIAKLLNIGEHEVVFYD